MAEKQKKSGLQSLKALAKLILEEVKKLIANAVSGIKADLGSALTYKGTVATYDALPKEGQVKGDTYNVDAAFEISGKKYPEGTNVAWDGTKWDPLGGVVDLSGLATKTELQGVQSALGDKLDTSVYEEEKADFLTEDDLEDYAKSADVVSNTTYNADKATFETSAHASQTYQTIEGMSEYAKSEDLDNFLTPSDFEEYTEAEIKSAISDLLTAA